MFAERLKQEYETRRGVNARYSLRAFARFLGTDHATLAQILAGKRRMPPARIRAWAKRLGIDGAEVEAYCESVDRPEAREALRIANEPLYWGIVELCRSKDFQPDSRWIASRLSATVDEVNMALTQLLRFGLLELRETTMWSPGNIQTRAELRAAALARGVNRCRVE